MAVNDGCVDCKVGPIAGVLGVARAHERRRETRDLLRFPCRPKSKCGRVGNVDGKSVALTLHDYGTFTDLTDLADLENS